MLDFIEQNYTNFIWLPFVNLVKQFESSPAGIYVLIAVLIIVATIQSKMIKKIIPKTLTVSSETPIATAKAKPKHKINTKQPSQMPLKLFDKVFTLSCLFLVALIAGVCFVRFGPAISDFLKVEDTPSTPSSTDSTTPSSPGTLTEQTITTYQAPKQLYYFCSCSSCWADGCPRDGYSYSGYDSSYYYYYYSLCKACSCNSVYARSYWK